MSILQLLESRENISVSETGALVPVQGPALRKKRRSLLRTAGMAAAGAAGAYGAYRLGKKLYKKVRGQESAELREGVGSKIKSAGRKVVGALKSDTLGGTMLRGGLHGAIAGGIAGHGVRGLRAKGSSVVGHVAKNALVGGVQTAIGRGLARYVGSKVGRKFLNKKTYGSVKRGARVLGNVARGLQLAGALVGHRMSSAVGFNK